MEISQNITNSSFVTDQSATITGWTSGPLGRGTSDIIWSSFSTIFLCTWTVLCLNLPHPEDSEVQIALRKAKWMFWAIMAPEVVLSVAIGQYASARRSVRRFHDLGYPQWTLRHAFFVDMGGIQLHPKDSVPFVVTSRQLAYLVQSKYLELPYITEAEILDKSKADTLAKLVTLLQACWFLANLAGRVRLGLAITTLELFTGAIVFCTFGTFICWLRKPNDVRKGIVLTTGATTADILRQAGDVAAQPYVHTPLDFVAKEHFTTGFDVFGFFNMRCDRRERPLRCIPNDRFPDIKTLEKFLLFCMSTIYAGLHLLGWRFSFPSRTEVILWRVSSLIITGVMILFWTFETIAARYRFGRWDKYLIMLRLKKPVLPTENDADESHNAVTDITQGSVVTTEPKQNVVIRQNSLSRRDAFEVEQKKQRPMPAWEVYLLLPVILIYTAARVYQIVESLAGLRELPVNALQTFQLTDAIPHL